MLRPSAMRRKAPVAERLNTYVLKGLAGKLRVRCAVERRSLSDAVSEAIADWLKKGK